MKKMLLMLTAGALLGAPLMAQTAFNSGKGGPSPVSETALGCTAIPDDAYDGTLGSMACVTVSDFNGIVQDVSLEVSLNHTWIGDLVIKLQSPTGTVVTLLNRPGFDDVIDDGTGGFGDSSDLLDASPLSFTDFGGTSAEQMGSTIGDGEFVCQDDGICTFFPFAGSGPGMGMVDFLGEDALGDWMVCVGDAGAADTGDICSVNLDVIRTECLICPPPEIPVLDPVGLAVLLASLGLAGVVFLRRRI